MELPGSNNDSNIPMLGQDFQNCRRALSVSPAVVLMNQYSMVPFSRSDRRRIFEYPVVAEDLGVLRD